MIGWGSDVRQGEGWWLASDGKWWWLASDGKWYSPEAKPDTSRVPRYESGSPAERRRRRAGYRLRRLANTFMLLLGLFLAGVAGPGLLAAAALEEEWSPPRAVVIAVLSIVVGLALAVAAIVRLGSTEATLRATTGERGPRSSPEPSCRLTHELTRSRPRDDRPAPP